MLEIRLLSQFTLRLQGEQVEIPTRPAQSLFAYLALHAGIGQRREKLAGLFWPDAHENNARSNLRHALWRIRKVLNREEYLLSDDLTITFNSQSDYWLDTAVFQSPLSPLSSLDTMTQTLSVYTGPLLPGFYEAWVTGEQERLHSLFEQKIALLLQKLVTEQQWTAVLPWAEQWIHLSHAPEPAFRALMQTHAALGNLGQVTAVYQRCRKTLESDLGVPPSDETETLYQQLLRRSQPATRPRHNLPRQLTSFIGRQHETQDLLARLTPSPATLLTLLGPGGSGKTRLALEVGTAVSQTNTFTDGVWLVELAAITDAAQVEPLVATTLPMTENGRSLGDTLRPYHLLLILDNCEHLITTCAKLAHTLLSQCPHLSILATSREPLHIPGEQLYPVSPLSVPDPYEAGYENSLTQFEAVQLFCDRAALVTPGFQLNQANGAAVAQICYRLDGLPLAIELAAARVNTLHPQEIANRLHNAIRLLTNGRRTALPRQQTLHATIEWSYHLLTTAEQTLFRQLAVFAGGWTLETAEAILHHLTAKHETFSVLQGMGQLGQKSLLVAEPAEHGTRYHFLQTIEQFARQKLQQAGEERELRQAHLDYFGKTAELAHAGLAGPERHRWLPWITAEQQNLYTALRHATQTHHPILPRLAAWLGHFWHIQALERCQNASQRAQLLYNMGFLAWAQNQYTQAETYHRQAITIGQQMDNPSIVGQNLLGVARITLAQSTQEKTEATLRELENLGLHFLSPADLHEYQILYKKVFTT